MKNDSLEALQQPWELSWQCGGRNFLSPFETETNPRTDLRETARQEVFDYIEMFYNSTRKHKNNGRLPPVDYEIEQKKMNDFCVYIIINKYQVPIDICKCLFVNVTGKLYEGYCITFVNNVISTYRKLSVKTLY